MPNTVDKLFDLGNTVWSGLTAQPMRYSVLRVVCAALFGFSILIKAIPWDFSWNPPGAGAIYRPATKTGGDSVLANGFVLYPKAWTEMLSTGRRRGYSNLLDFGALNG
jgi:hypothetical protein